MSNCMCESNTRLSEMPSPAIGVMFRARSCTFVALDALVASDAANYGDGGCLFRIQARLDSFVTEATAAFEAGEEWAADVFTAASFGSPRVFGLPAAAGQRQGEPPEHPAPPAKYGRGVARSCGVAPAVRRTDYVESVSEKEIVICLNMIRGLGEAELVMRRLSALLEKSQIDRTQWNAGCAMYPVHGYNGGDLINFARQICTSAIDERNRELLHCSSEPDGARQSVGKCRRRRNTGFAIRRASRATTATQRRTKTGTKSRAKKA